MKSKLCVYLALLSFPFLHFGFISGGDVSLIKNGRIYYLANTLVVKLKSFHAAVNGKNIQLPETVALKLRRFGTHTAEKMFPDLPSESGGLNNIVIVRYTTASDPHEAASELKTSSDVEWAEPKFLYESAYIPNDPSYGTQWALPKISAPQAWDISKGDTSVIIAINDTGVDWDHPDLSANIWRNWNEIPTNGIDDDGNGFIDDIMGWDFGGLNGTPDNNPMEDRPEHGSHVAGIASAVTDNSTGIASIGFNSTIMPVKTSRDDVRNQYGQALISYGYEGIIYAVDNGAKVINASWGGSGFSILGQEVINYAIANGTLIIAAAGNDNSDLPFYPASYAGVLSVASTDQNDLKSGFSNFGTEVDVSAPGSGIYSTWQSNVYATLGGTSMASPHAAGLAALVASVFPSYNPVQIAEQIRVNSDNIDAINPSYQYMIGKGRINAFRALNNTESIAVRAVDINYSDEAPGGNGDGIFQQGETITVSAEFVNYLSPVSGLNITLESRNSNAMIINGSFNPGPLNTLEQFNNNSSKFTFNINTSAPNAELLFLIKFNIGSYSDYQGTKATANPTYGTQTGNDVALTITSKGTLAFNDYPNNTQGRGFKYLDSSNLLFEGALILGTSSAKVSDAARSSNQSVQSNDFTVVQPFIINIPGTVSDYQGSAVFNDNNAGASKIGLTVTLQSYTFTEPPNENFIILRYSLTNNNAVAISNLFSGLFFDWDMIDGSGAGDVTSYDNLNNFAYVHNTTGGPTYRIATALLSSGGYNFYAIKNDGTDGGIGIYDGFTDSEKWLCISNGISKPNAGPDDVSHVISGGPYVIDAGQTIHAAFVVAAGADQDKLISTVQQARTLYQAILTTVEDDSVMPVYSFSLEQNYPNPFNPATIIKYSIPSDAFSTIKIYDINGQEVEILLNEHRKAGEHQAVFNPENLSSGVYFYKLTSGRYTTVRKLVFLK